MTRFARAKGSKASNLKTPDDSTPWEVMKEHMLKAKQENEETKKREEAEQQRIDNYNNFLKEHRAQKRKATWCDFPEVQSKNFNIIENQKERKKKKKTEHSETDITSTHNNNDDDYSNKDQIVNKKKQKKKKKKVVGEQTDMKFKEGTTSELEKNPSLGIKKKKNKKSSVLQQDNIESVNLGKVETSNITINSVVKNENNKNKGKKKKNPLEISSIENSAMDKTSINQKIETNNHNKSLNKKHKTKMNDKPNRRKPINDRSFQLIINGKEVELVRYDGFPIMQKDAERLDELKRNMIKKGIPKSEVQRTMKLERRRAEKALARVKRDVCYNCRKGGHNLSDCPALKSNLPGVDAAEGLCFKCGSTEHRQFECKVQRDKEFRFATCFICKESGHIARQCPDNPKGLYPNGGCCKLCGDVTHLRKDCPTVNDKKEDSTIKLQSLYDDNVEDIPQKVNTVSQETIKMPKKIKF